MSYAPADGLRIAYDDLGRGEPAFLLLPGWVSDRSVHALVAERLSEHRRVLLLDWRGHGGSDRPAGDFGTAELVADALAVVRASRVGSCVPVAQAHAGWAAIELARVLAGRITRIVLLNWLVLAPPPWFMRLNELISEPQSAASARDLLVQRWLAGVTCPRVRSFVTDRLATADPALWSRSAGEILRCYTAHGSPLRALAAGPPPPPVLHLYAQPADRGYLEAQRAFAAGHGWFSAERIEASSIFTTLEVPRQVADRVLRFCREGARPCPSAHG